MIKQSVIVITFFFASTVQPVLASKPIAKVTLHDNEHAIEFTANEGQTTDAIAGFLSVKENRNSANSRDIRINYVRFPATGKKAGHPIIYLSGGPGGSGIQTAKYNRFSMFQALREFGDVIALDQRGTGDSEQMNECVTDQAIDHNELLDKKVVKQQYKDAANYCLQQWQQQGADIYGYTTEQNALDIDALRKHVGAEKVTLWGISYGSHLAMAAMKLSPKHIDKVIIASAEGLNQTVKSPAQTDAYFSRLQAIIEQQPLKQQVPNIKTLMKRAHEKLDKQPMPISTTYQDGSKGKILLQSDHLKMLASRMISDPNRALSMLIQTYAAVDTGNIELIGRILSYGMFKHEPISFRLMPLAMDIASGITDSRLREIKQQAQTSLLGEHLNFPMPLFNNIDPKLDLGDNFRENPKTDIPTLLFSGTLDGRTYPEEQFNALSSLTSLTQITVQHAGHNLFMSSPAILETMQAFLAGKSVSTNTIEIPMPNLTL